MSLRKNVVRSSVANLADQGVKFVAIFIITPVMILHLGEYRYGIWLLLMNFFAYYNLLDLGVGLSGTRFAAQAVGAEDESRLKGVLATCFLFFRRMAIAAAGVTAIALFVAPLFSDDPSARGVIRGVVAIFGFTISLRFLLKVYQVILKSFVRHDLIVAASIVRVIAQSVAIYWFLLRGHGLITIAVIHALCETLEYGLYFVFARRTFPDTKIDLACHDKVEGAKLFKYSLTTFGATTGHFLKNRVDPFLVGGIVGVLFVPVYSIGTRLVTIFNDVVDALFGSHLLAAFSQVESRDGADSFRSRVLEASRISVMFTTFLGASIAIFAGAFIERWVGPGFADSYRVLLILIVPYTVFMMQYPAFSSLFTLAKHRFIMISMIAGGVCNIVLSVILGLIYGFFGIIWATFVEMTILYLIVFPLYACHATKIPRSEYFAALACTCAKTLLPIAIFYFCARSFITPDYLRIAVLGTIQSVFFLPFAWFLILKKHERSEIARILRERLARK